MSDNDTRLKESLSALMDDSADELEVRRVLSAASEDSQLRDCWSRYQLARSAMRDELPPVAVDLSGAIADAIADEPSHSQGAARFLKPLSRVAIAASVTVVAVLGIQQYNQNIQQGAQQPSVATATEVELPGETVPVQSIFEAAIPTVTVSKDIGTGNRQSSELVVESLQMNQARQQQMEKYLNELIRRHTERAALGSNKGMLPFARLVEDEKQQEAE